MRGLVPATLLFSTLLCACGETDTLPGPSPTSSTSTGTSVGGGGTGGTGGGSGGTTSAGGSGGSGGSTTNSGGGGASPCGNGVIDPGESCDGAELGDATCEGQGYPGGTLACDASCGLDISKCTGADLCTDGLDNDGDTLVDCEELDCEPACADACLSPVVLVDPGEVTGSTVLHAGVLKSSCVAESGPEVVYAVTAASTGYLEVVLFEQETAAFSLSVRSSCAGDGSELACSSSYSPGETAVKRLSLPVTAGQVLFVVVDGDGATTEGAYALGVQSHPVLCGDSLQDPPEGCDDGNAVGGDGCSATCTVESTEQEPNNTLAQANPFSSPWIAQISPVGDVDFIKVTLPSTASLSATTTGVGEGTCSDGSLDSHVSILDGAGNLLAVSDDLGGGNLCSHAVAASLPAGDYYVRVAAAGPFPPEGATFPYLLAIETFECGDATVSAGEECDDGNVAANDGCSPSCTLESDESEPNGTVATANAYSSPWIGRIDPDGDIDVVSVTVAVAGSKITAITSDPTGGAACAGTLDSYLEILDAGGAVLATNDDAIGYCSSVSANNLPAGKYHVRVQAPPILGQIGVFLFPYALDVTVQ